MWVFAPNPFHIFAEHILAAVFSRPQARGQAFSTKLHNFSWEITQKHALDGCKQSSIHMKSNIYSALCSFLCREISLEKHPR